MKNFSHVLFALFFAMSGFVGPDAFASEQWISARSIGSELKKQKRKGNILVSATCRNDPSTKNLLKPQAKLIFKPNTANKEWLFIYMDRKGEWKPGRRPGDEKEWSRINRNRFSIPGSGATFTCSLWHHKTAKLGKGRRKVNIYSKTSLGISGFEFYQ